MEREISGYKYQVATDRAITGSRHNGTPVQSYSRALKASQQMRAAPGDPRRGEIPVELIRSQPSDDFPSCKAESAGVSGTNRHITYS